MSCEGQKPGSSQLKAPRRNRYYYGKLLDEFHLRMETEYQNDKRWLLNRLSLGNGVLCGLNVTANKNGGLLVSTGVAIDAWGREIIVPSQACIDPWKTPENCCNSSEKLDLSKPVFLCLAYQECQTEFQPALVTECESQNQTQAGTIVEGYKLVLSNSEPEPPPEWPNTPDPRLCDALKAKDVKGRLQKLCELFAKEPCTASDAPPCVMLAKIELNIKDKGIKKIDCCTYKRFAFGNETLFEMIMCLANGGVAGPKGDAGSQGATGPQGGKGDTGPKGDTGLGLYPDLPKILDIGWKHNQPNFYVNKKKELVFISSFLDNSGNIASIDELKKRITSGQNAPPFTIYFNKKTLNGIDPQTFNLRIKVPVSSATEPLGFYIELSAYGEVLIIDTPGLTPHTKEQYLSAASFIPHINFFKKVLLILLLMGWNGSQKYQLPPPEFSVRLKGDFIWEPDINGEFSENGVLDADNIGGRVGEVYSRKPPIQGGINPSGNLTQGGDFESWFQIILLENKDLADIGNVNSSTHLNVFTSSGFNLSSMPTSINLADKDQLMSTGLTEIQAKKIISERTKKMFISEADLVKRIKLSDNTLASISSKIIMI
jgi:hypothetical protein